MGTTSKERSRARGAVQELPSGALRVRVYAGYDPLTGQRHYLTETIPAGPGARREAEKARTRLLSQVDEGRNPKTRATLNQLLDAYLEVVDVGPTTKPRYERDVRLRLRPVLGSLPLGKIEPDVVERFYAQLRICRDRCGGKQKHIKHRTQKQHDCDEQCRRIACEPLSASSIRSLHWVLNSALKSAVRWRWIATNPLESVVPPAAPKPDPRPPTPAEAARILEAAIDDPNWGAFVWTAMTTGARRGELCALRRTDLDLDAGVLQVAHSMKNFDHAWRRLDTKTHQKRRIALDPETVGILREHMARLDSQAEEACLEISSDAYLFSLSPDASEPMNPDTVTQRYDRLAKRLKIDTTLHKLRHFSATELIAAGVDVRTVAGRLGHSGGGTTTLRVYAAWVSEADQRAAQAVTRRMPKWPTPPSDDGEREPGPRR